MRQKSGYNCAPAKVLTESVMSVQSPIFVGEIIIIESIILFFLFIYLSINLINFIQVWGLVPK